MNIVLTVLLCVASANGPVNNPELNAAIRVYEALSYRAAVEALESVLRDPMTSSDDRKLALAYLARSYAVLDLKDLAKSKFQELLGLDPSFRSSDRAVTHHDPSVPNVEPTSDCSDTRAHHRLGVVSVVSCSPSSAPTQVSSFEKRNRSPKSQQNTR